MTRWRDWVIDAFNRNLPFDQFTIEQLAGDLLPDATLEQKIASGFHRNHMINYEGGAIPAEYQTAYVVDRVNTTATVWLGLTIGCAQCHDHKFDPITQREYYQLYAFFHNVAESGLDGKKGNAAPVLKLGTADRASGPRPAGGRHRRGRAPAERALPRAEEVARGEAAERGAGRAARPTLPCSTARVPTTMVMEELAAAARHVHPRPRPVRQARARRSRRRPGDPAAAAEPDAPPNRLALARWLVDPGHPLDRARDGQPLLADVLRHRASSRRPRISASQGELPSHPELLDWLAVEFVAESGLGRQGAASG